MEDLNRETLSTEPVAWCPNCRCLSPVQKQDDPIVLCTRCDSSFSCKSFFTKEEARVEEEIRQTVKHLRGTGHEYPPDAPECCEADLCRDEEARSTGQTESINNQFRWVEGDPNVDRVAAKLHLRSQRGMKKFGVSTEREDLPITHWLHNLQEELLDAAVYIEAVLYHVRKVEGGTLSS